MKKLLKTILYTLALGTSISFASADTYLTIWKSQEDLCVYGSCDHDIDGQVALLVNFSTTTTGDIRSDIKVANLKMVCANGPTFYSEGKLAVSKYLNAGTAATEKTVYAGDKKNTGGNVSALLPAEAPTNKVLSLDPTSMSDWSRSISGHTVVKLATSTDTQDTLWIKLDFRTPNQTVGGTHFNLSDIFFTKYFHIPFAHMIVPTVQVDFEEEVVVEEVEEN